MPNAFVLNTIISSADLSQLNSTLIHCGFNPTYVAHPNISSINIHVDVVVVLIPIDGSESISVLNEIAKLGPAGARIVGLWLGGAAGTPLPKEIGKYGYSAVCFASVHVCDALQGISPSWEDSNCEPSPPHDIPRNRC